MNSLLICSLAFQFFQIAHCFGPLFLECAPPVPECRFPIDPEVLVTAHISSKALGPLSLETFRNSPEQSNLPARHILTRYSSSE